MYQVARTIIGFTFIFLILTTALLLNSANANTKYDHTQISLIKLTISPEEYENHKIIVSGFLVTKEGELPKLYFNSDSYKSNAPDYIYINDFPKEKLTIALKNCVEGCSASIIGVFAFSKYNSPLDLIGFMDDVRKVVFW
jgi:hypothetical protein|tara:strand:- start:12 stop:431 length:420 start_codon:yes stop_codon:yes gene_type:complete